MKTGKRYTASFKNKVSRRVKKGESVRALAKELEVSAGTIYMWTRKRSKPGATTVSTKRADTGELKNLREENKRLRAVIKSLSEVIA